MEANKKEALLKWVDALIFVADHGQQFVAF